MQTEINKTYTKLEIAKIYIDNGLVPIAIRDRDLERIIDKDGKKKYVKLSKKSPVNKGWNQVNLNNAYSIFKRNIEQRESYNIGIITGPVSNIIVIDIDVKDDGLKTWNELMEKH
jgi:hypothetical protein